MFYVYGFTANDSTMHSNRLRVSRDLQRGIINDLIAQWWRHLMTCTDAEGNYIQHG